MSSAIEALGNAVRGLERRELCAWEEIIICCPSNSAVRETLGVAYRGGLSNRSRHWSG
ncbi:hypothetical protein SS05631_a47400 (plasmid) [Sinorhizobium sp. CCBAU 05631]|nr:hypothetical protein SS05631_a47400 [Sinorhizobium sp. CCBAU 05631]